MFYKRIDTSNIKPELDFEQVQSNLAKFKSHAPMPADDVIALMKYIGRFEQLISEENYSELGYMAEKDFGDFFLKHQNSKLMSEKCIPKRRF